MSRIHRSEAQANAEALARRSTPFGQENRTSAGMAFDWRRRQAPRDLSHAVSLVRRAYQDEVPTRLHEHGLADDGTPAMTARAEAYIFGSPTWTDAGRGESPIVSYYLTPFRALLEEMQRGDPSNQRRAAIVSKVTIGGQGPAEAAIALKAHPFDAKMVAMDALCSFLRRLSDVKVSAPLHSEHAAA